MEEHYDLAWDRKAGEKLKEIYDYIRDNYSEKAAQKVRDEIIEKVHTLKQNPERYPPERLLEHRPGNFRYLIVRSYKVVYEFGGNEIRILYIQHTSQNPDNILKEIK